MFFISILSVLLSSYFITSILLNKNSKAGLICFLLISFAQIVLSFEMLSLFSLISKLNFLYINIFVFMVSFIILKIKKKSLYKIRIKDELLRIFNALKTDNLLKFASIFFIVFLISELLISVLKPISFGDALSYYLPRCTNWIMNGNINHFDTFDIRELIMPVNMDLLYTWKMLFTHNEHSIAIFSYIGLINAVFVIYHFLGELGFCRRKRLWAVFIFSSFSIVGLMSHTPCADLFTGSLILTSIYLFVLYCKYNDKLPLYFSSLAYILAIGTKSTAFVTIPAIAIIFFITLFLYKKKIKPLVYFLIFSIINFVIFSSYNYILNCIQFGNPLSSNGHILLNQFRGGIIGYIYNLINYVFLMFDGSGAGNIDSYNQIVMTFRDKIINVLSSTGSYSSPYFNEKYIFSSERNPVYSLLGLIGIFTFYPALFLIFVKKSKKYFLLKVLSIAFIINVLIFSGIMVFTKFNARYLVTFVVIASPILACTYVKNNRRIYKWIIMLLLFVYLFLNPCSDAYAYIINTIKNGNINNTYTEDEQIYKYLINNDSHKIALILGTKDDLKFHLDHLKLKNKKADKLLIEKFKDYNLKDYDTIITSKDNVQYSSFIVYSKYDDKNYISECKYFDNNKKEIKLYNGRNLSHSVRIVCKIPYSQLQGFEEDKNIPLSKFIVYKRKLN